jgi:hypothetical protein
MATAALAAKNSAKKNAAAINRTLGPRPTLGARKARGQQLTEVQRRNSRREKCSRSYRKRGLPKKH